MAELAKKRNNYDHFDLGPIVPSDINEELLVYRKEPPLDGRLPFESYKKYAKYLI